MSMEKDFECQPLPGDKKIEVSVDHRTLILVKNSAGQSVVEICVVGSPGNRKRSDHRKKAVEKAKEHR
jgi:hypothetical protein